MKKSIVLFAVACAAYGATLLALGIYIIRYDIAAEFANWLVEKTSFVGFILVIVLYIPILLMRIIPYAFIIYGTGYIIFCARAAYKLYKSDLLWLHKNLRTLHYAHCCLSVLLVLSDAVIIPFVIKNIQNGISVPLIVFTVLFNITAIALEVADIFAVKKLRQSLI